MWCLFEGVVHFHSAQSWPYHVTGHVTSYALESKLIFVVFLIHLIVDMDVVEGDAVGIASINTLYVKTNIHVLPSTCMHVEFN